MMKTQLPRSSRGSCVLHGAVRYKLSGDERLGEKPVLKREFRLDLPIQSFGKLSFPVPAEIFHVHAGLIDCWEQAFDGIALYAEAVDSLFID